MKFRVLLLAMFLMTWLVPLSASAENLSGHKATTESRTKDIRKSKPHLQELAETSGGRLVIYIIKGKFRVELHAPGWEKPLVYPMTAFSGYLGPKLMEGDEQIPEGVYEIKHLNPRSAFYLSMKVGYPNSFDKKHAKSDGRRNLGGDIMIHGGAATIGCIPIGDDPIEDVFYLVSSIKKENVRVIIAPYDMRCGRNAAIEEDAAGGLSWYPELCDMIEAQIKQDLPPMDSKSCYLSTIGKKQKSPYVSDRFTEIFSEEE